ncbi:hypothetical protein SFUMM280S_05280 [Streptomyces fumanus]
MTSRAEIDVRPITEAEFPDWNRALNTGFLQEPVVAEEQLRARRHQFVPGRLLGAFDAGRCVATFRSFAQEVTAVGGAPVPADAISNVTVSPTHRRRGLLGRMMARDLAAARERGDVVATLIAAEYPIYGRYGFGPATTMTEWSVDVPRAGLDPRRAGPADGGRIDLVDGEDVRKLGPELHDRLRRGQPGAVSRNEVWWRVRTGALRFEKEWTEPFFRRCDALGRGPARRQGPCAVYRAGPATSRASTTAPAELTAGLLALTPIVSRSRPDDAGRRPYFHWTICSKPTAKTAETRARTGMSFPLPGVELPTRRSWQPTSPWLSPLGCYL